MITSVTCRLHFLVLLSYLIMISFDAFDYFRVLRPVQGFASHMTEQEYCDRELQQGVLIMGKAAVYEEVLCFHS
jgi:hypothetical protein